MLTIKRLFLTGSALALAALVAHCGEDPEQNPTRDMKPSTPDMATVPPDMTLGAAPTITTLAPTSASNAGGTMLTITGTGFVQGATVTIGGTACTNVMVTSATQVTCTIPAKAGSCVAAAVVVTNPDQQSVTNATGFSYFTKSVTFANAIPLTTATAPSRIIAADLNKDGLLDIATANKTTNNVSVFLQLPTGAFATKVDYTVGTSPADLVAVDVTGDGNVDIVTVNATNISVLAGVAATPGTFAATANYAPTGLAAGSAIAAGDYDKDNKTDIVVVGSALAAYVLKGAGTATATFPITPTATLVTAAIPGDVAFGDLDKDTNLDVFVTNTTTNNVSYFKGNGTAFAVKVDTATTGTRPTGIFPVDIDKDGFLDIVTANNTSSNVSILKGNGTALAAGVVLTTAATPESVFVADVNNDGILDIATASPATNSTWSYLRGLGQITFAAKVDTATGNMSSSLVFADFDKDGLQDLALNNSGTNSASVFKQTCSN